MSALDLVKKHPYLTGGSALIIVSGTLLLFSGGGNAAPTDGAMSLTQFAPPQDPNAVAAASAAQLANITAQAHTADTASQERIALATINASTAQKQLEKDTAFHIADLTAAQTAKDSANANRLNMLTIGAMRMQALWAKQAADRKAAVDKALATAQLALINKAKATIK